MKASKITAKLRDAVPVCIYADGNEQHRYKNIELPDSIKALEIMDFGFDIDATGWISFHLYFDQGILPEEFPEARAPKHRKSKERQTSGPDAWSEPATEENAPENPGEPSDDIAAYLPADEEVIDTADLAAAAAEVIAAAGGTEITVTPAPGEDYNIETPEGKIIAEIRHKDISDEASEAEDCAIRFDVPGKKRGELARAIGEILAGEEVKYLNPPSYAYQIGTLTLDRDGTLHGPDMAILLPLLAERGFIPAE